MFYRTSTLSLSHVFFLLVTVRPIQADICEASCKRHICTGEQGCLDGLSTSVTPYKIIRLVSVVLYVCSKQRWIHLSTTQWTYYVILSRFRVTTVSVQKK